MDVVNGTATNIEGCKLRYALDIHLKNDQKVAISFKNATPMTSSFLNSSIGELIDVYGYNKVVESLQFLNVNKFNANTIKKYFLVFKDYA